MNCNFIPTDTPGTYRCVQCGYEAHNISALPIRKKCQRIAHRWLTIGMATYKDFEGVWATIQSLKLYHDLSDCELLVVDNYGCNLTEKLCRQSGVKYLLAKNTTGTAAPRNLLFQEAQGEYVLCMDSHVMLEIGCLDTLKEFLIAHPTDDLLHGPLLHDDLESISTGFQDEWRGEMWGTWITQAGINYDEPLEIWGCGLGMFIAKKATWLGFSKHFRGFGGEEGYIHEKYRKAGRKVMLLPWMLWHHRFGRTHGPEYPISSLGKLRNYLIGLTELNIPLDRCAAHFKETIDPKIVDRMVADIQSVLRREGDKLILPDAFRRKLAARRAGIR